MPRGSFRKDLQPVCWQIWMGKGHQSQKESGCNPGGGIAYSSPQVTEDIKFQLVEKLVVQMLVIEGILCMCVCIYNTYIYVYI